jgi:predicted anti-sigma-YlaC factor YlaD
MADVCTKYQEDLSALMDQELKGSEKTQLEEHLIDCKECLSRFESLKSLSQFLEDESVTPDAPSELDFFQALSLKMPSVCEVIDEDLSAYIDAELPPHAQEGVKTHLAECVDCLEKFKLLNSTNQLLSKGLELPKDIDVNLWDGVKTRLAVDCEIIESELSAYIDQEVDGSRHLAITNHLMECRPCQSQFERMACVGSLLRENYQPKFEADFDLWPGIKSKMQVVPFTPRTQAAPARLHMSSRSKIIATAAAVFMAFMGTGAYWLSMPDDDTVTPLTAEGYLIESSFDSPGNAAEEVIYEQ